MMRKVELKIVLEYDDEAYDHPTNWNWVDIIGADDEHLFVLDVDYDE